MDRCVMSLVFSFLFGFAASITAFIDNDLHCGEREHLSGFVRIVNDKQKEIGFRCSKFAPQLNEDVTCTLGKTLKCNGNDEGCDDPDAWIGGFQAFDSGSKAELYRPYCCKSDKVTIKPETCREVHISTGNGKPVRYFWPPAKLMYGFSCQYVKDESGNGVKDMIFSSQECRYSVDPKKT